MLRLYEPAPKATLLTEEYDVWPWIDPYGTSNVNGLITIESFLRVAIFANDTFHPSLKVKAAFGGRRPVRVHIDTKRYPHELPIIPSLTISLIR